MAFDGLESILWKTEKTTLQMQRYVTNIMASKHFICLPKMVGTDYCLRNWRSIFLLCAVYKLVSGVLERMKPCLDNLISKSQTCYIKA